MLKFMILLMSLAPAYASDTLKVVDLKNKTMETQNSSGAPEASLSPQEAQKLLKDIEKIRANQVEAQKFLDELESEN